jgi:hypothetical protein
LKVLWLGARWYEVQGALARCPWETQGVYRSLPHDEHEDKENDDGIVIEENDDGIVIERERDDSWPSMTQFGAIAHAPQQACIFVFLWHYTQLSL